MKLEGEKKRGGLVGSAFALAASYLVLCLVCFLMIVINDPAHWTSYFVENYTDLLTLAVCALLLCFIVYYYYYFEDRAFVAQARNVVLVFSLSASSSASMPAPARCSRFCACSCSPAGRRSCSISSFR